MSKRQEFAKSVKLAAWQRCGGRCEGCSAKLYVGRFDYDHDKPDAFGGEPTLANCRVLCIACHGAKTSKHDVPMIAKSSRVRARHLGIRKTSSRPMPGSKASGLRKKFNGTVERRS